MILDRGWASALILEDDTRINQNAHLIIEQAQSNLPENWDILFIGCFTCEQTSFWDDLINWSGRSYRQVGEHLVIPTQTLGTHAYAVSAKGAGKLLQMFKSATYHVDWAISSRLNDLDVFAVTPSQAYQAAEEVSTLGSSAPVLLNRIFTQLPMSNSPSDSRTWGWFLSEPLGQLWSKYLIVNGWVILVLVMSCFHAKWTGSILAAEMACSFVARQTLSRGYIPLVVACGLGMCLHSVLLSYR